MVHLNTTEASKSSFSAAPTDFMRDPAATLTSKLAPFKTLRKSDIDLFEQIGFWLFKQTRLQYSQCKSTWKLVHCTVASLLLGTSCHEHNAERFCFGADCQGR